MHMQRRQFIKIAGATAAAGAVGGAPLAFRALADKPEHDPQTDGDHVVPSFCEMCFWKCGVLAHVKDGRVTKIVGNPEHPLSAGRLCPRGTGGTGLLYDPDRLTSPLLRRQGSRGQDFEEVSWDRALDHLAERMEDLRREHGPEALALFAHGYGGSWFKHLLRAYGTATFGAPSHAQCRGTREAGFELTYGAPVGSPEATDMANARAITLIGSHLGENMHNTQVQSFAEALRNGAELIVVDPRFSTAAGKARHWLPIRPGTDIALLLAWMHVIIRDEMYDREYLEEHAIGFEELRAHVASKTPEWAAAHTGIAAATIEETARVMAAARPASLIHPGRHTAWYGNDTQRARAIAILNALLGSWGRRGGFVLPSSMSVPPFAGLPPYPEAPPPPDRPNGVAYPFSGGEGLAHGMRDASLPGAERDYPFPIKGWFVYGSNLVQSLPQPAKTIEALQTLDLVVTVDVLPVEITGYADVVLPEATYLERYDDLHAPSFESPYVALRQPAVEPLEGTKPGWWIARELGRRLDLERYFPWEDVTEYLDARLRRGGHSLREIQRTGVLTMPPPPRTIEEGLELELETPSGKIELYSARLAEAGLDPIPDYQRVEEPPEGSFRLLFGRAPTHTFGRTTNNRFLGEMFDENHVWVNATRARELGFHNGDRVVLENQDGVRSEPLPLRATQGIRPDCVYMVHGFGHTDRRLRHAFGRGADDAALVTRVAIDPAMGGTGMNVNFV
ncbi:MAG: molybdopterin-dependent oxidoreductase, partial [Myxococcales bacterium]|nr:molybdopterin-dependent oxidoreductase [Myxococcales bacterium]